MRLVLTLAIAIGSASVLPAAAASADGAKHAPCRPPIAFARADAKTANARDEPRATLLLAVDRRINGCRVLTPANARSSWLPEPADGQGPARKRPATQG